MTADQSRPVSRVSVAEALTQIRALCDRVEMPGADGIQYVAIESVRAVLDAVSVHATPAQGRKVGTEFTPGHSMNVVERATPPQSIDEDELFALVYGWDNESIESINGPGELVKAVLALVRPVEGVVLSPEEARLVLGWYPGDRAIENPDERALASRLEVS